MAVHNGSFLVNVTIDGITQTVSLDAQMVEALNSEDDMIKHQAYGIIQQKLNQQPVPASSLQPNNLPSCSPEVDTAPTCPVMSDSATAGLNTSDCNTSEDSASCSSDKSTVLPEDEESNTCDQRWGKEPTLFLIEEYENRAIKVNSCKKTKKALWFEIANCLKAKGYTFSPDQVAGRWKSLVRAYKNIKDGNKKSGSGRKTFPFESRLDEILIKDPSINPEYVSTSRNQSVDPEEEESGSSLEATSVVETNGKGKTLKRKRKSGGEMLEVLKTFMERQDEKKMEEKEQRERMHREKIDAMLSLVNVLKNQK